MIISMFGPSEVGIIEQNLNKKEEVQHAIENYYHFYSKMHPKPHPEGIMNKARLSFFTNESVNRFH